MLILQSLLRTTSLENFRSIGQILLKISFLKGRLVLRTKMSFKLMATEIVKIKLHYFNIRIS